MVGNKKVMSINTSNLMKWSAITALMVAASTMVYGAVGGPQPGPVSKCDGKCSLLPGKACPYGQMVCCCVDGTTGKHKCICISAAECPQDQDDNCPQ